MTHPPCLRLCPAHPGNPRSNIEGESPLAGKGHTVFETHRTVGERRLCDAPQDEVDAGVARNGGDAIDVAAAIVHSNNRLWLTPTSGQTGCPTTASHSSRTRFCRKLS